MLGVINLTIKGNYFNYKGNHSFSAGIIAHETGNVTPEVVSRPITALQAAWGLRSFVG